MKEAGLRKRHGGQDSFTSWKDWLESIIGIRRVPYDPDSARDHLRVRKVLKLEVPYSL